MKYWTIIKIVWPLSSPSDGGRRSHDQALAKKFHLFHLASYKLQVVQKRSDMQIWCHLAGGDAGTGVWSDQRGRAWKWTPGQIRHTHNSFIPPNLFNNIRIKIKVKVDSKQYLWSPGLVFITRSAILSTARKFSDWWRTWIWSQQSIKQSI